MACRCRLPSQGTRAASIGRRGASKPQARSMLCRVIEHALRTIEKKFFTGISNRSAGAFWAETQLAPQVLDTLYDRIACAAFVAVQY